MLNLKKVILTALLATSVFTPGVVYAGVNQAQVTEKPHECREHNKEHDKRQKELREEIKAVEKYVPGAENEVKELLRERRNLSKELRELELKKLGVDTSFMNDFKKTLKDTHEKVKKGQMTEEDAKKYIYEQKEKFEKEHAAEIEKMKKAKTDYEECHKDEMKARRDIMRKSVDKLEEVKKNLKEAVESGDTSKVKNAYNNYLNSLKESNQLLKNEINKLDK